MSNDNQARKAIYRTIDTYKDGDVWIVALVDEETSCTLSIHGERDEAEQCAEDWNERLQRLHARGFTNVSGAMLRVAPSE
jgi:hypothetical protein